MPNGECPIGANLTGRVTSLERSDADQWEAINDGREKFEEALREIANRLPNWAAVLFMVASGVGGAIIGVLGTLLAVRGG
ncbi:MAG: hypothetical protein OEV33_04355 [Armatimonadota bacterium]|nr:hypothetical protein [Armatimonadota bacterium]